MGADAFSALTAVPELRVLAGPQTGACLTLAPGATIDVGSLSASGCQVVLRDPRVSEQRLRLHVRAFDVRIELLVGSADLAGRTLTAPCTLDWPHFVALTVGDTVMAVGDAGNPRWDHVALTGGAALPVDEPRPRAAAAVPERAAHRPRPRRRLETWLAVGGSVVAASALGLMAFVTAATPARPVAETAVQRLDRVLKAPEFRGLRIERGEKDQLRVRGLLLTLADRARLDRGLASENVDASVDVRVGEQITAAVRDVYRMNGVNAEILPTIALSDVGKVQVRTGSADAARLARIEATVRQDVPGVQSLEVVNTPPPTVAEVTPVRDDPGKRVASIVPGDNPYVVTADGTRYFIGALLPSGHRLAGITDSEVMLEKDGKSSPLKF